MAARNWLLAAVFLVVHAASAGAGDPLQGVVVVAAKVTDATVRTEGQFVASRLEITHVYVGPASLQGKTFTDYSGGTDFSGAGAVPALMAGEEGIWSLRQTPERLQVDRIDHLGFAYRARPGKTARYPEIRRLAAALEEFAALPADRQPARLRELALGPTAETSAWAVQALAVQRPEQWESFLEQLAENQRVPVAGQMALDEVLGRARGERWHKSAVRGQLLEGWTRGKWDEWEAGQIVRRLRGAGQEMSLDDATLRKLWQRLIENLDFPPRAKAQAALEATRLAEKGKAVP